MSFSLHTHMHIGKKNFILICNDQISEWKLCNKNKKIDNEVVKKISQNG